MPVWAWVAILAASGTGDGAGETRSNDALALELAVASDPDADALEEAVNDPENPEAELEADALFCDDEDEALAELLT